MHIVNPLERPRVYMIRTATVVLACLTLPMLAGTAYAATFSAKDTQIIAKAIGFLDPAPAGGVIAVAYDASVPASKADAEAISGLFTGGLSEGSNSVTAKTVDAATLGDGSGYIAVIAAQGVSDDKVMQAAKAHHIPCVTADVTAVQSGQCVMSVSSNPKVDIVVNHAAALATGVLFQSAFRMLIHEV